MVATPETVLFLCIWVLVISLATRDVVHGCVWVVALGGILRGVGLAHGVAIPSVLLLFSELSAITVYDEAAVKVEQEGEAERNNEAYTALVENRGTSSFKRFLRLAGRGQRDSGSLELVQAVGTFVDDCRTEGVIEECDDNEDAHCEPDQELDPEEERVGPDEGTVANDCTDKAEEPEESEHGPHDTSYD